MSSYYEQDVSLYSKTWRELAIEILDGKLPSLSGFWNYTEDSEEYIQKDWDEELTNEEEILIDNTIYELQEKEVNGTNPYDWCY